MLNGIMCSCGVNVRNDDVALSHALKYSGSNRHELECVIDYYKNDSLKLLAAKYLIVNMPGHYSYKSNGINEYYAIGENILKSSLSPIEQRDTLLKLSKTKFAYLEYDTIEDIKIIKADFLIKNIDDAFELWQNKPWLYHLDFEQFCEYVLPYKCYELQSLDYWRDTLNSKFGDVLSTLVPDDDSYYSPYKVTRLIRQRIANEVRPYGVQMGQGYSFGAANNMYKLKYGECSDYVRLAICIMRSIGLPVFHNSTPQWGRYRAGHDWYALLNDKGEILSSEWDISSDIGSVFFPYQRIPKVYQYTYSINHDVEKYLSEAVWQYPFDLFQKDVTDSYFATSNLKIPITLNKDRISDKYVYLCAFNGCNIDWNVITYGSISDEKDKLLRINNGMVKVPKRCELFANFQKIGRNVLYIVFQYDENGWFPLSKPFILHANGAVEYVTANNDSLRSINIRRKYYSNQNVVEMKRRLIGGRVQASSDEHFLSDTCTLLTIEDIDYPDRIPITSDTNNSYRYIRYISPNESYGSLAELAFFSDSLKLCGKPISSCNNDDVLLSAFDDNYLTNFETDIPNDNWVGLDLQSQCHVTHVRIVPRNDDNYVRPGDEYELFYWDNEHWVSVGKRTATDNSLSYDNIPYGALLWLRDYTRGMDERPFLIEKGGNVVWW